MENHMKPLEVLPIGSLAISGNLVVINISDKYGIFLNWQYGTMAYNRFDKIEWIET